MTKEIVKEINKKVLNDYIKYSKSMIDDDILKINRILETHDYWLQVIDSMEDFKRHYLNDLSEKEDSELAKIFLNYDEKLLIEFREYCRKRLVMEHPEVLNPSPNFVIYFMNMTINDLDNYINDFLKEKKQKNQLQGLNQPIFKYGHYEKIYSPTKPKHYNQTKHDLFDCCEYGLVPIDEYKSFLKLNIFKYCNRYNDKNGVEDLEKAKVYLDKLIEINKKSLENLE